MVKLTNNTTRPIPIVTGRDKNGEAITADVRPGETKDVDLLDRNAPFILAHEAMGMLTVEGGGKAKPIPAPERSMMPAEQKK